MKHKPDRNTIKIKKWINQRPSGNRRRLKTFLASTAPGAHGITVALFSEEHSALRKSIVGKFEIK
jgi:hypothetical protein